MEAYQIFKMILGIIASILILGFVIIYITGYSSTQEEFRRAKALNAFSSAAEGAYLTGSGLDFDGFARVKEAAEFDRSLPGLKLGTFKEPFSVPVLYSKGEELFVSRSELDLGWWKVRYVTAMPETRVVFNPLDTTEGTWETIRRLVSEFPSGINSKYKTTFASCDGENVESPCGNRGCQRDDFLDRLEPMKKAYSMCRKKLGEKDRLVMVSVSCPKAESLCINPSSGMSGRIQLGEKSMPYKDPVDIMAAILGGPDAFEYKNTAFFHEIRVAAMMIANSALAFSKELAIIGSDIASVSQGMQGDLDRIEELIPALESQKAYLSEEGKKRVDAEIENLKNVEVPKKRQCISLYKTLNETIYEAAAKADDGAMKRLADANMAVEDAKCTVLPKRRQLYCIIKSYTDIRPAMEALQTAVEDYEGPMAEDISAAFSRANDDAAGISERLRQEGCL